MMTTISSLLGAGVFLYMFYVFSTSRKVNVEKLILIYVILVVANFFLPVNGVLNGVLYYGIMIGIYLLLFRESVFTTAVNSFLMFLIHYTSALLSTCIVLLYERRPVDFRYALKSEHLGYVLIFFLIAVALTVFLKNGLYKLNRYFDQIKDNQRYLTLLNTALILGLFLYLRLYIQNGILIASIRDTGLAFFMGLRLLVGVSLFFWLLFTTNRLKIVYKGQFRGSGRTVSEMVIRAKVNKTGLSVIYLELPYYTDILKRIGPREAKGLMHDLKESAEICVPEALLLGFRENAFSVLLEQVDEAKARRIGQEIVEAFGKKNANAPSNAFRCLVGVCEYDPLAHETHRELLLAAQENAYR